jgi:peptidoglycan/LPS O-acetylase OafA/YrhL
MIDLASPAHTPRESVAPPPGHRRFPLIDALRALAALSILVFHMTQAGYFTNPELKKVAAHLNVGVPLFFAISGFVLFRPYLAAGRLGAPAIGLRAYAIRRIARIVPAYWVCLVVAGAAGILTVFGAHAYIYFGFAQVYVPHHAFGGLSVAWSLGTEMMFYALLPLIAAIVLNLGRVRDARWHWVVLTALAVPAGLSVMFHLAVQSAGNMTLGLSVFGTFYLFYVGMALAVISVRAEEDERTQALLNRLGQNGWALWFAAAAGFAIAVNMSGRTDSPVWPPYGILAGLVLLPAISGIEARPVSAVLCWRPLAFAGVISYGIYLWHLPVLTVLGRDLHIGPGSAFHAVLVLVLCTMFTLAIAWTSYRVVELPCIRWAKRVR